MTIQQMVEAAAQRHGVPVQYAVLQAKKESSLRQFDASGKVLRSSAGALGVMQLLPSTARDLGVDPADTAQNIEGGMRYDAQLYRRYNDWALAFAAYNWGMGNVDKWRRGEKQLPTETRNYVIYIMGVDLAAAGSSPGAASPGAGSAPGDFTPGRSRPVRRTAKKSKG